MHWWNLSKQLNIWMMYPPGDKEITDFTLLDMVILSTEEEVEEGESGFRNGGFRRGYSQGNNTRAQQAPTVRSQPVRQEDDWSSPTNVERREDTEKHQTSQAPPPDVPPPTEERLFTDWSSVDSPRERVNQHNQSARSVESNRTVNQTEQPTRDPEDNEVLRYVLSDVMTTPST